MSRPLIARREPAPGLAIQTYVRRYLPNPFALAPGESVDQVLERYDRWLRGDNEVAAHQIELWEQIRENYQATGLSRPYGQYHHRAANRMIELLEQGDRYRAWIRNNAAILATVVIDYQGGAKRGGRTHVDVFREFVNELVSG